MGKYAVDRLGHGIPLFSFAFHAAALLLGQFWMMA